MRVLPLLALGLLLAGSVAAKGEGRDSFTLVGHFSGGAYFWTLNTETARNPDLIVVPNATITIHLVNEGTQVHNLQVEGHPASRYVSEDEPETTYAFVAPASGALDYWCQPHKANGMAGRIVVAGSEVGARETSAVGVVAGMLLLGVLAIARRR